MFYNKGKVMNAAIQSTGVWTWLAHWWWYWSQWQSDDDNDYIIICGILIQHALQLN